VVDILHCVTNSNSLALSSVIPTRLLFVLEPTRTSLRHAVRREECFSSSSLTIGHSTPTSHDNGIVVDILYCVTNPNSLALPTVIPTRSIVPVLSRGNQYWCHLTRRKTVTGVTLPRINNSENPIRNRADITESIRCDHTSRDHSDGTRGNTPERHE